MPVLDHKNMTQRVVGQFFEGSLERLGGFSMDMFARLYILEGAAGVPPGLWLTKGARGFGDALEYFGPGLAAAWTSTRNEGVYDKALASASRVLSHRTSGMDASDLVQNLILNSTRTSGPNRSRIFYAVGSKLNSYKHDLGVGNIEPRDSKILGTLERWVRQAAIDQVLKGEVQHTRSFAPGSREVSDPTNTQRGGELTSEKRNALMLLALQSPGGPGRELRRIIDRLIDQSFPKAAQPIVKVFLQKIGEPKYRSPDQMRKMLSTFHPEKWFGQAVNLIRQEMMNELKVSPQYLTNILGSKANNIFRFMKEKVGRDSSVQRILEDLAQEIDLLEPGSVHLGKESELTEDQTPLDPHGVMLEWLRQSEVENSGEDSEKEAEQSLPRQHPPHDFLHHLFEPNEHMDWGSQALTTTMFSRGPSPLRVAEKSIRNLSKAMLRELTKAALTQPELRSEIVPLVRLGHEARVASHEVDLRGITIRTAYATTNLALRSALVNAVIVAAEKSSHTKTARQPPRYREAFVRWFRNKQFRHPETGNNVQFLSLPSHEQTRHYQQWQQDRLDWANRYKPEGLGSETRITPQTFKKLREGDVVWRSDSPVLLHRITRVNQDRAGNPVLEMVQFDRNNPQQEGETRHLSMGALRNEFLEYHRVPGMGPRAQREQARARLPTEPRGGWPEFDDIGLSTNKRERVQEAFRAMGQLQDPHGFSRTRIKNHLREHLEDDVPSKVVKEFMHQLKGWAREMGETATELGLDQDRKIYRAIQMKLDQGISETDGSDRQERQEERRRKERFRPHVNRYSLDPALQWDDDQRSEAEKIYGTAYLRIADGHEVDTDFVKDVVKKLKDKGLLEADEHGFRALQTMVAAGNSFRRQPEEISEEEYERLLKGRRNLARQTMSMMMEHRLELERERENHRRRQEGPPRHQDRQSLHGGGRRQMDHKAKLNSYFIGKILPVEAPDEVKARAKEQLKQATYGDLERLRVAASHIVDNWDSEFSQNHALVKHLGYDRDGLKKLQKLLNRKLEDVNGRLYHDEVLEIANRHELESEDADALYDWRMDKPARALSDQEKMNRFLAKAKPETRERMQGMSLNDFMVMYKSIFKDSAAH